MAEPVRRVRRADRGRIWRVGGGPWPSLAHQLLARNDVGEGDAILVGGQERTPWAGQLGICATFGGN